MAGTSEAPQNTVQKRNDAYTGLLAISFLAMVGATVLLYLEYQNYEGKTPPKAPTIEVPGALLKTIPKTGDAPPPPPPMPKPDDMPPPKENKDATMLSPPPRDLSAPFLLPPAVTRETAPSAPLVQPGAEIERAEAVQSGPERQPGVVQIPDVPLGPPVVVPVVAKEPAAPAPRPIIQTLEPSLTDDPPVPAQRFVPPM